MTRAPNPDRHREVLASFGTEVTTLTDAHEERWNPWFPSEVLPQGDAKFDLPPDIAALLVLNTLTEEGLPSFHRLLATHLGEDAPLVRWTDRWTAEEDRHGTVLRDYLLRVRGVSMLEVEKMQFAYQLQGFRPDWQYDPYQLLAYALLQEWATQVSHQGVVKLLAGREPVLEGILAKIAKEEAGHLAFYRTVFAKVLERDPNEAILALGRSVSGFVMPGHNVPGFPGLFRLSNRLGMFTPKDFANILRGTSRFLHLESVTGLDEEGERARDRILARPARLAKVAEKLTEVEGVAVPPFSFLIA